MMYGWDGGMSVVGWIFMVLFWVLLIVAIVWAITQVTGTRGDAPSPTDASDDEPPDTILARRLARGEIDLDTYRSLREALHDKGGTPAGVG